MKSIKPGRGSSLFGGVFGIIMICFGFIWTVTAGRAYTLFAVVGILWTAAAAAMTVFSFRNAVGKSRFSAYDIIDAEEEPDPLNQRVNKPVQVHSVASRFCPYCGAEVKESFVYCNQCGKRLPCERKDT